jgi:alkylation response protein AidB-like acyl-CoA dehydrogenase
VSAPGGPGGTGFDADALRDELSGWLADAWDPDASLLEWRTRLADAGWARPSWPLGLGGRGLPVAANDLVDDVLRVAGVVGAPDGVGVHLAAPTLLAHGDAAVVERLVRATATGELWWCQLFSEPGAGSDLAGLTTAATRDGDAWVVRGQKVWTTSAGHADVGLLLARTDRDVPKHAGLTMFVVPMRQPGVEVRPLRQMNGHASFNEVFLDDAHVPPGHVVGDVGDGWRVALTTLAHERRLASVGRGLPPDVVAGRVADEALEEHRRLAAPYRWYPQRAGRADLVAARAAASGLAADPRVRQEVAGLDALVRAATLTSRRAAAARAAGRPPGPEGSLGKLASSRIAHTAAAVHTRLAGADGMLTGDDALLGGVIAEVLVSVPAVSIAGGTDEVQRTILAERILGLPREPDPARELPFRDYPTSASRSPR